MNLSRKQSVYMSALSLLDGASAFRTVVFWILKIERYLLRNM
jgi:hypothetical protein